MGNGLSTSLAWLAVFYAGYQLIGEWRQWSRSTTTFVMPTGLSVQVELANTPEARSRGLADRDRPPEGGLLLEWPEAGHHPIWMADVRFPLDLVWLDQEGQVLAVVPAAPPCSARPCPLLDPPEARRAAHSVLELTAGGAARQRLTIGTRIRRTEVGGAQ